MGSTLVFLIQRITMIGQMIYMIAIPFSVALVGLSFGTSLALRGDTMPEIIDPPLTQFAWVGRPVTFKVSLINSSAMSFQWQWNEADLLNATNRTFRIPSAQLTHGGDYRVVLANAAGVVTSAL